MKLTITLQQLLIPIQTLLDSYKELQKTNIYLQNPYMKHFVETFEVLLIPILLNNYLEIILIFYQIYTNEFESSTKIYQNYQSSHKEMLKNLLSEYKSSIEVLNIEIFFNLKVYFIYT